MKDIFEVAVSYPEKLYELHNDFPFLSERIKIKKVEKLVANLHDKLQYILVVSNFILYYCHFWNMLYCCTPYCCIVTIR